MVPCSVIGFTLLLITVSYSSFPLETAATETKTYDSVRKIFGFVKQKSPELAATAGVVFESSVFHGSVAVKWVGDAVWESVNSYLHNGTATRDIGSGIYNSVKQNLPDLNSVKDVYKNSYSYGSSAVSNVESAIREGANRYLQDEKARSFVETMVFTIRQELAKGVPATRDIGSGIYNSVKQNLPDLNSVKDVYKNSYSYGSSAVSNVESAIREGANRYLQYEKARPFVETMVFTIRQELAKGVPATRDIGSGIYNSVKQNLPDLNSVKDVYKNSYSYGSSAVSNVESAIREGANRYLQDEKARSFVETMVFTIRQELAKGVPATRDIGSGIYNSVKQNLPDLNSVKDVYKNSYSYGSSAVSNVESAIREGANRYLQDEKARSFVETMVFTIRQELAKGVPGGVPAYNFISKTFHGGGDKNSQDNQDQSEVTKLISEVAKTVVLYAIEKGAQNVPGGAPAYKLISQYLQLLCENEDRRELKELHVRIDKLEREGCGCKKLHNKNETLDQD